MSSSPLLSFVPLPLGSSVSGVSSFVGSGSGTSGLGDSAADSAMDSDFSSFLDVVFFCAFFFSASTYKWC